MSETLKAVLLVLVATPIIYGLGATVMDVSGYRGNYGDGRLLFAISFFVAFSMAKVVVRGFMRSGSGGSPDGFRRE
jgi:hypothetical protein